MVAQLDKNMVLLRPSRAMARFLTHFLIQGRPLMTRARWINRYVFAQFSIVKRLPQLKKVAKPIYIVGLGRSGTTILGRILSLHPEITLLNEPKALWYSINPEDDINGNYSLSKARYRLDAADATTDIIQAANRLYGFTLFISGSRRILDKYQEMIFRVSFLRKIFPESKFVFLVRNGWDAANSIDKWSKSHTKIGRDYASNWWGVNGRKWRLMLDDVIRHDPSLAEYLGDFESLKRQKDKAIVEWIISMKEGLRLLEIDADSLMLVHYERLTHDPIPLLNQLFDYCELARDEIVLKYATEILKPVPEKEHFKLPAFLSPIFNETMQQLGY